MKENEKLFAAIDALDHALEFEKEAREDSFYYGGIAKAYEVALEYAWKGMKREVMNAGLEAESPRDAIKQAGKLNIISKVEVWLDFLKIRNIAVHDYLGIGRDDYLKSAHLLRRELGKLKSYLEKQSAA